MKSIEYKKVNLRDFRHNLTRLKDSMAAGQALEVYDRGVPAFTCIPKIYEFEITKKKERTREEDKEILQGIIGILKVKDKENFDYKKEYDRLIREKYSK